jgi:FkbM family methyltransferase
LKRLFDSLFFRLGYHLQPLRERRAPERLTGAWLRSKNIQTIIDAGGGGGDFAKRIRKLLPDAKIISFETHEPSFKKLKDNMRSDKNFEAHFIALNNYNGTATFRISSYDGSSSLLPMADLHKDAYPITKSITEVQVDCKRLDDLLDANALKKNILFKLDVQGAEKLVMEGAEQVLQQTKIVFCEINFQELYEGCVLATDLIDYLKAHGLSTRICLGGMRERIATPG